jgi:hypothetical protein
MAGAPVSLIQSSRIGSNSQAGMHQSGVPNKWGVVLYCCGHRLPWRPKLAHRFDCGKEHAMSPPHFAVTKAELDAEFETARLANDLAGMQQAVAGLTSLINAMYLAKFNMSHEEVVDQIIEQLKFQDKHGGYFHQEPYKGDFFRLFVAAAEEDNGLRADRLHSLVAARAPELFDGENWPLLYAAWPEWDYAWSQAKQAR